MCGLFGYNNGLDPNSSDTAIEMDAAISHRGPDGKGVYQDDFVTLGHRLLAISNNPNHHVQPMQSSESAWVLLLDGEIYNLDELKSIIGGDSRDEQNDTRLLYEVIEKFGWDFHFHISGMFTIVLYNKEEEIVRCYADPSGQKNLYYYFDGKRFVFSSEIKGVLAHPEITPEADYASIQILCTHGYIPGKQTIVQNISKIQAAEILSYDFSKKQLVITTLPKSEAGRLPRGSFEETSLKLIGLHTKTKFPIALNLSGGIDSSFLFFLLKESGVTFSTFSTKFLVGHNQDSYNQDAEMAARLSNQYDINHHELTITPEDIKKTLIESLETIEEPNCGVSIPAYHLLARKQKELGFKVVISGEGGDELFGGYPHYQAASSSPILDTTWKNNPALYLNYYQPYMKTSYLATAITPGKMHEYIGKSCSNYLREYMEDSTQLNQAMYTDRCIWLAGQTFVRAEKTNLHHGLELRCPLAYQPYRHYVDTLLDNSEYISKEKNKIYLRKWLSDRVPDYITKNTKKLGWTAPVMEWYDAELQDIFIEILDDAAKNFTNYVDWNRARDAVQASDKWPGRETYTLITLAIVLKSLQMKI
jgi:asparagine synthase (glutamine-hydrolysing)